MAIILNLETATTNCSVSLAKDGKEIILQEENTPSYSHSEQLHVFIQQIMEKANLEFSDLDAIAVSKGPGSYTGLRIGVSAAKGLCFAMDLPLISVPTLESLARQSKGYGFDYTIPVLDARRMEVYSAVFDRNFDSIIETEAKVVSESSFVEFYKKGKTLLLGPGAKKCKEVMVHPNLAFWGGHVPSAKDMKGLSYQKYIKLDFEDLAYFEPYYLKDFMVQKRIDKSN